MYEALSGGESAYEEPDVLSARWAQLEDLGRRSTALCAAIQRARVWMEAHPARTLGSALKTMPLSDAQVVSALLREAGVSDV